MQTVLQDLRYALRQFRKSPGFTAIAVISLALAIGANTTIFSFANQMLFVKLGVPQPKQLRMLTLVSGEHSAIQDMWGSMSEEDDGKRHSDSFTFPVYQQLRKQNTELADIFGFKYLGSVNITANGAAQAAKAELVSGNFYQQMQLKPQLGRLILPSDEGAPGSGNVVVLSDAFWHRAFGGSPDVLGKTITIDMTPVTIVGINPATFTGPDGVNGSIPDVFLPLSLVSVLHPGTKPDDPL